MRGILLIYAHPDDESFWGAGVAARYHDEGVRTALVMATRGERGSTGDLCTIDELPRVREQELREVARIIPFDSLEFLDYQDQQLAAAPVDDVRRSLVHIIRRERPLVAITFDPNGMNGHADHMAISRFASDALAAAADPRWYPDMDPAWRVPRVLWPAPLLPWRIGEERDPAAHAGVDFVIDTSSVRARRADALRAHRTQFGSINRLFLARGDLDEVLGREMFRQAWGPPLPSTPAADLFEGLPA